MVLTTASAKLAHSLLRSVPQGGPPGGSDLIALSFVDSVLIGAQFVIALLLVDGLRLGRSQVLQPVSSP